MKGFIKILPLVLFFGCGSINQLSFDSLVEEQPKVVSVLPQEDQRGYEGNVVEVGFSEPIDPKTVTSKSFLVTAVAEGNLDVKELWKKAREEKIGSQTGSYDVSPDGKTVRFQTSNPFPNNVRCGVLITPEVLSQKHLPLNQTPGEGPTPFLSTFYAVGPSPAEAGDTSTSPPPSAPESPTLSHPSFLRLNEVLYDAIGSDTEGALFIELFGEPQRNLSNYQILMLRGSDGHILNTLKIPEGMQTNGEGFFVVADAITGSPGITNVLNADWVINFDPPNGPDCIQLLDPDSGLVDVLGYGSPLVLRGENNLLCYETLPAPDAPAGSSLRRILDHEDSDNNAADWEVSATPSPGRNL